MSTGQADLYTDSIHNFLRIFRYVNRYARQIRSVGISGRRVGALRRLLDAGPQTIGQLSAHHYINDSSTSEMVAHLEKLGYVKRTRSTTDSRVVLVEVTPAGEKLVQEVPLGGVALLRVRLRELPAERLRAINQALKDIVQILEINDAQ